MKYRIKISAIFMIIAILMGISSNIFATDLKTTLEVIQKASEIKYLENDQGNISKTIVDSNADTGEVTIELKLSNTKKETQKVSKTEIMLVIDNSASMNFKTATGETRKSILLNSAKKFVNTIMDNQKNIEIGIVRFYSSATLVKGLTSNKSEILKGIQDIENHKVESSTNIQKGLIKAEQNFSKETNNKIIILLTDGIPNYDADYNSIGNNDMIMTNQKYLKIIENTKKELINANQTGIKMISVMTGVNSNDVDEKGNIITSTEDDIEAIKKIFGTPENPTVGKFYNAKTTDVSEIIENNIVSDVQQTMNAPINTINITDYFPKDIAENFEFSYVEKPSMGTISDKIDSKTNTIIWNIEKLKGNETASIKYKLKIKDMKNTSLLNKTIATNEKVVMTYQDTNQKNYTVTLSSSPKISLIQAKESLTAIVKYDPVEETTKEVTATIITNKQVNSVEEWNLSKDGKTLTKTYSTNKKENVHLVDMDGMTKDVTITIQNIKDATTANGKLPQTGINNIAIILLGVLLACTILIIYIKIKKNKDIK